MRIANEILGVKELNILSTGVPMRICVVLEQTSLLFHQKGHSYLYWLFNSLHPNITMHILHTVLRTFSKRLTRRICSTIKSCFSW